ncbi:hypothetical protein [Clostridium sp. B9]|uniref:hypothetical protein n=1 Tax=Clostridium sp. B9 TaxID=3423224 RepID=UPI003D2EDF3D
MELDFFRMLATLINIAILIGIIVLIFKFIKGTFGLNKRIVRMEKDIEEIKNELKNR